MRYKSQYAHLARPHPNPPSNSIQSTQNRSLARSKPSLVIVVLESTYALPRTTFTRMSRLAMMKSSRQLATRNRPTSSSFSRSRCQLVRGLHPSDRANVLIFDQMRSSPPPASTLDSRTMNWLPPSSPRESSLRVTRSKVVNTRSGLGN